MVPAFDISIGNNNYKKTLFSSSSSLPVWPRSMHRFVVGYLLLSFGTLISLVHSWTDSRDGICIIIIQLHLLYTNLDFCMLFANDVFIFSETMLMGIIQLDANVKPLIRISNSFNMKTGFHML